MTERTSRSYARSLTRASVRRDSGASISDDVKVLRIVWTGVQTRNFDDMAAWRDRLPIGPAPKPSRRREVVEG
ncbi:MAG: hypothetical protein KY392_05230, partial [Chloroflexi bacterium]|nr:hypothetical protein [Chloroflexota bacterium]